jgi:hypothetical protein
VFFSQGIQTSKSPQKNVAFAHFRRVLAGPHGDQALSAEPDAVSFLRDADRHHKAIALAGVAGPAKKTHVDGVVGVTPLAGGGDISKFIEFPRNGKVWERDTA